MSVRNYAELGAHFLVRSFVWPEAFGVDTVVDEEESLCFIANATVYLVTFFRVENDTVRQA